MKTQQPKKRSFLVRYRQWILLTSGVLFAVCVGGVYFPTHKAMSGHVGQAASWGLIRIISELLMSLPWWFLCLIGIGALYLWFQHKLIMSIVYGVLAGVWLAL